jgi:serine/threonine protein kinase
MASERDVFANGQTETGVVQSKRVNITEHQLRVQCKLPIDHQNHSVSYLNANNEVVTRTTHFPSIAFLQTAQGLSFSTLLCAKAVKRVAFVGQATHPFIQPYHRIEFLSSMKMTAADQGVYEVALDECRAPSEHVLRQTHVKNQMHLVTTVSGRTLEAHALHVYGNGRMPTRQDQTMLPFAQFVFSVIYQLSAAFLELGSRNIVYGNCSPQTVLYDAFRVRLAASHDVTFRKEARDPLVDDTERLNPHYDPPEVLKCEKTAYDTSRNVWSVAMIAVFLLARTHPGKLFTPELKNYDSPRAYIEALHQNYTQQQASGASHLSLQKLNYMLTKYSYMQDLFGVLEKMLTFDPLKRPSFHTVIKELGKQVQEYEFHPGIVQLVLPFMQLGARTAASEVVNIARPVPTDARPLAPINPSSYLKRFKWKWADRIFAIQRISDLVVATNAQSCFVLGIHVWERYCMLRNVAFREFDEYVVSGYVAQFVAWCILLNRPYPLHIILDRAVASGVTLSSEQCQSLHASVQWMFEDMLSSLNGMLYEETFDSHMRSSYSLEVQLKMLFHSDYYDWTLNTQREMFDNGVHQKTSLIHTSWWQCPLQVGDHRQHAVMSPIGIPGGIEASAALALPPTIPDTLPGMYNHSPHTERIASKIMLESPDLITKYIQNTVIPGSAKWTSNNNTLIQTNLANMFALMPSNSTHQS